MGVDIKVLTTAQYFGDVTKRIRSAKKGEHISAITMNYDPSEPFVSDFMDALRDAAKKGFEVTLAVDAHSFMISKKAGLPNGPLIHRKDIHKTKNKYYKKLADSLDELEKAGGRYKVINLPKGVVNNPKAGRSHIKAVVVGNDLYVSGSNLRDTNRTDLSLLVKDETAADYVFDLIAKIIKVGSTQAATHLRDRELALDNNTSLLVDSGARGQSLILEQALDLIDNADEWLVMTCQYFPYGITARHLAAARSRGVKVRLYYGHPTHHENLQIMAHRLVIAQERTRNPKELFELQIGKDQPHVHAKIIASEKGAIIGSHNYVTAGVKMGTAEMAILRRDPQFAAQAARVIEKEITSRGRL